MKTDTSPLIPLITLSRLKQVRIIVFIWLFVGASSFVYAGDTLKVGFEPKGGFFESAQNIVLKSPVKGATIYYTTDGSEPSSSAVKYTGPISINKTTVIRAKAYVKGVNTEIQTNTYFVGRKFSLPVVSISTHPDNFFSFDRGIYVKGCCADSVQPYQGANFWKGWERPINIEYFDLKGKQQINQRAGVRIFGGFSKGLPMKSLAIISRKKYQKKYFKYPIFEEKPHIKKYKSFILRNSGGDFNKTHFRDALITQLARPTGVPIQAYQPVVLFINGEYWGIHNAREKLNEYYFKHNYGADPDSIDIMKHRNDLQEGERKHYKALLKFMTDNEFTDNDRIAELDKKMNISNYLDHHIAQVYCDNGDAGGNIRYWRPQRENARWNWVLFDTDLSMGIGDWKAYKVNTLKEMTSKNTEKWPNPAWSTFIIRKLLENDSIKQLYITRLTNYLNTIYSEETVVFTIDSIQGLLREEMPFHQQKWGGKMNTWDRNVNVLRDFGKQRPHYMRLHMQEVFGLKDTIVVKATANHPGLKALSISGLQVKGSYKGVYFKDFPLAVDIKVKTGYVLKGWVGDVVPNDRGIVYPSGEVVLEPIIEKREHSTFWNQVMFNELCYANTDADSTKKEEDWVELYNATKEPISLKGWRLNIKGRPDQQIPDCIIGAEGFLVLAEDKEALLRSRPNLNPDQVLNCKYVNLDKDGFKIFLLDSSENIVDSLSVQPEAGKIFSSLRDPKNNLHTSDSWEYPDFATPNAMNPGELKRQESEQRSELVLFIVAGAAVMLGLVLLIIYRSRKKRRNQLAGA